MAMADVTGNEPKDYLIYGWKSLQRQIEVWNVASTPDQANLLLECRLHLPVQL